MGVFGGVRGGVKNGHFWGFFGGLHPKKHVFFGPKNPFRLGFFCPPKPPPSCGLCKKVEKVPCGACFWVFSRVPPPFTIKICAILVDGRRGRFALSVFLEPKNTHFWGVQKKFSPILGVDIIPGGGQKWPFLGVFWGSAPEKTRVFWTQKSFQARLFLTAQTPSNMWVVQNSEKSALWSVFLGVFQGAPPVHNKNRCYFGRRA